MHMLGQESTELFEGARDKVAAFIGAPSRDEVVFTKNSSEALNLVANVLAWADQPHRLLTPASTLATRLSASEEFLVKTTSSRRGAPDEDAATLSRAPSKSSVDS